MPVHNHQPPFAKIVEARFSRRQLLRAGLGLSALAIPGMLVGKPLVKKALAETSSLSTLAFREIEKQSGNNHSIAPGYHAGILLRWGDPITKYAPPFNPDKQTEISQSHQFGYNNDFIAFMPFPE